MLSHLIFPTRCRAVMFPILQKSSSDTVLGLGDFFLYSPCSVHYTPQDLKCTYKYPRSHFDLTAMFLKMLNCKLSQSHYRLRKQSKNPARSTSKFLNFYLFKLFLKIQDNFKKLNN